LLCEGGGGFSFETNDERNNIIDLQKYEMEKPDSFLSISTPPTPR